MNSVQVATVKPGVSLTKRIPLPTIILAVTMFFTGACGLVYEYILSTMSTYILGNSIEQFSVIIALMLLMMGLAGYLQKFISDKGLIGKFVLAEVILALIGGFAPFIMYASYAIMEDHFSLVQYFLIMSIGFLIGLEIPMVARINEKYIQKLGSNIASTWSFDYIGSFVGAIVWVRLLKSIPLTSISFILAGLNLAVALLALIFFARKGLVKNWFIILLVVIGVGVSLIYGSNQNLNWSEKLEQRLYDEPIVFSETTKYQRLVMTHNKGLDDYRLYINGNLQFSSVDEKIYHEQLIHPVMSLVPDHERVLILGGGDGLAVRELLKYPDVKDITLVDLDPDMISLASKNAVLQKLNKNALKDARVSSSISEAIVSTGETKDIYQETGKVNQKGRPEVESVANVNVFTVDADKFLGGIRGNWNVIVIDLPDPTSVELAKLYSKEFYMKVRMVLAENGMVVVQSTSPYHAKEAYLNIVRTMKAAGLNTLPYHDNVPSFGDWGWVMGSKIGSDEDLIRKAESLDSFKVKTSYLTPDLFVKAQSFGKGWLKSEKTDVSTLMNPTILTHYVDESWKVE